jgi:hypothetical protein
MHKCLQVSGKDTRAAFAPHSSLPIEDGFIAMGVQALLALAGEACTPAIRAITWTAFARLPAEDVCNDERWSGE